MKRQKDEAERRGLRERVGLLDLLRGPSESERGQSGVDGEKSGNQLYHQWMVRNEEEGTKG